MGATMTDTRRAQVMAALGTPNYANETRFDFDDLIPSTTRKRYVDLRDATRIVPGADDLVHPMAGRSSGGVAHSTPEIPDMTGHAIKTEADEDLAPRDLRTEGQINYMELLISWIAEKDAKLGADARAYTDRMTAAGKWQPGRGGNVSIWIDRLKAKNAELKDRPVPVAEAPVAEAPVEVVAGNVQHDEMPVKENKNGKPMPMYYAVEIESVTKFYRIKAGTKPGWWWIDAQASDDFHPVKNVGTKNMILRAILAQGAEECLRNYGRLIGSCARCHATLTDETSRANGIGPDCEGKM